MKASDRRRATATFEVLTLPPQGPAPADARLILAYEPVGRVAVSLTQIDDPKEGRRDLKLHLADLSQVVRSFGGCPVYGWDFFDRTDDDDFEKWSCTLGKLEPWDDRLLLFHEDLLALRRLREQHALSWLPWR